MKTRSFSPSVSHIKVKLIKAASVLKSGGIRLEMSLNKLYHPSMSEVEVEEILVNVGEFFLKKLSYSHSAEPVWQGG